VGQREWDQHPTNKRDQQRARPRKPSRRRELHPGGYTWQPFVAATILHEFAGSVTSTQTISATGGAGPDFDKAVFTTLTGRVGTYEQIGFGTAVVAGNTGWLGYARGDVKFGDNVDGWGINLGLRYHW
jgi:hypothetical protein